MALSEMLLTDQVVQGPDKVVHLTDTDSKQLRLFSKVKGQTWTKNDGHMLGNVQVSRDGGLFSLSEEFAGTGRYLSALTFCMLSLLNVLALLVANLVNRYPETLPIDMASRVLAICGFANGGAITVAIFEMVGLLYIVVMVFWYLYRIKLQPHGRMENCCDLKEDEQTYTRWLSCHTLFKEVLPLLQAFSALHVLGYIVPTIMIVDFNNLKAFMLKCKHSRWKKCVRIIGFISLRMIYFFFGFEAFLVKLAAVYPVLTNTDNVALSLVTVFAFLNQLLGVVNLKMFANARLFEFVFGGTHGGMEPKDKRRMHVWQAGLQLKLYEKCDGNWLRFAAAAVTFSDHDFQMAMLAKRKSSTDACEAREEP